MKTDAEKLIDMIRTRMPALSERELDHVRELLEESRIRNISVMKERQEQPEDIAFPKLNTFRPFFAKLDKCAFGHWPQWDQVQNGIQNLYWWILRKEEGRMLLLCDNIIEWLPFDTKEHIEKRQDFDWKHSSLRKWMNETFYRQAFTAQERRRICFFDRDILAEDSLPDRVCPVSWTEIKQLLIKDASLTVRCQNKVKQSEWLDREYWVRDETGSVCRPPFRQYIVRNGCLKAYPGTFAAGVRPAIWILDSAEQPQ